VMLLGLGERKVCLDVDREHLERVRFDKQSSSDEHVLDSKAVEAAASFATSLALGERRQAERDVDELTVISCL